MFLTQKRRGATKTIEARQRFAPLRLCVRNPPRIKHSSIFRKIEQVKDSKAC